MLVVGNYTTEDAWLPLVVTGNALRHVAFGGHSSRVLAELRKHYQKKKKKDEPIKSGGRRVKKKQ